MIRVFPQNTNTLAIQILIRCLQLSLQTYRLVTLPVKHVIQPGHMVPSSKKK